MSAINFTGLNNVVLRDIDINTNTISFPTVKSFFVSTGVTNAGYIALSESQNWDAVIGAAGLSFDNVYFSFWYKKTKGVTENMFRWTHTTGAVSLNIQNNSDGEFVIEAKFTGANGIWSTNEGIDTDVWYLVVIKYAPQAGSGINPAISWQALGSTTRVDSTVVEDATPSGAFSGFASSNYFVYMSYPLSDPMLGHIGQFAVFRSGDGLTDLTDQIHALGGINDLSIIHESNISLLFYINAGVTRYEEQNFESGPRELAGFAASLSDELKYNGFANTYFSFDGANFAGPNLPLNSLLLSLNGPYGYSTFKQVRTHQNPLTRYQIANNIYSIVETPSLQVNTSIASEETNKINFVSSRYGNLINYDEMCINSKHKPLIYVFGVGIDNPRIENKVVLSQPNIERIIVKDSFGNEVDFFGNMDLNNRLSLNSLVDDDYERITKFYLDGGLDADDSPITTFELLKYSENIWPKEVNTYKSYTRQRTSYKNHFWIPSRDQRTTTTTDDGFGNALIATGSSMWNMDAGSAFMVTPTGNIGWLDRRDAGILQNNYSLFARELAGKSPSEINNALKPAPYYTRLHAINSSASVVAPSGIIIPETASISINDGIGTLFQGTALWQAADQSGKEPFYESYNNFISDIRPKFKDYSIIPEYRVSNHTEKFYTSGSTLDLPSVFELTGALSGTVDSSNDNFYKIYSTSDFLNHFAKIKKDHKGFVDPSMIKLTCRAVKKFVPYDSFYPQERTVDIARRFWKSYNSYLSSSIKLTTARGPTADLDFSKQSILNPLFAPGVLYNSIKAGVACDYPIISGSMQSGSNSEGYFIMSDFHKRIPFEALIDPQSYLVNIEMISNEPNLSGNINQYGAGNVSQWNGGGDSLYNMMASNFCAEVADFFLANGSFTAIQSLPQQDPDFGQLIKNQPYGMRIRMYRSMESYNTAFSTSAGMFMPPQDMPPTNHSRNINKETITMYSRPSAFGPACGAGTTPNSSNRTGGERGFNFPFTPPYYHGEAWVDITLTPRESRKHSVDEIIQSASYAYYRAESGSWCNVYSTSTYGPHGFGNAGGGAPDSNRLNENAMQISASLSIKGIAARTDLAASIQTIVANSKENVGNSCWTIQTRFETPILNFNDVAVTASAFESGQIPRGMWHQYGRLPQGDEGIYFDVTEIPASWTQHALSDMENSKKLSLAEAVGFPKTPIRLGNIRDKKIISEAIVAIPFIEVRGEKKFFELQRSSIDAVVVSRNASFTPNSKIGSSVHSMVNKMASYTFPPKFDFLRDRAITPFSMYIFEFFHELTEQDLADIWQGLPPKIALSHEESHASISHPLLAKELLGGGFLGNNDRTGGLLPEKIKWMVFKVKRRSKKYYHKKILRTKNVQKSYIPENLNYNWPYDYFSLVELAKIEAQYTFSDIVLNGDSITNRPKGNENFEKSSRTSAILGNSNDPFDAVNIISGVPIEPAQPYGNDNQNTGDIDFVPGTAPTLTDIMLNEEGEDKDDFTGEQQTSDGNGDGEPQNGGDDADNITV